MKISLIILVSLFAVSINYALAFDTNKIIDSVKKVVPSNINKPLIDKDAESVKSLIQSFENLTIEQKTKLAEFRIEYQKSLELLMMKFDNLPKEIQDLLKEEKRIRMNLSPKGQEDLNNYIKNKQENKQENKQTN